MLDICFAILAFIIIETLHTQISSLFLGKDGTALAYQVSGDYMKWIGYFFILWGLKWQQMECFVDLESCVHFLLLIVVNLAIRLTVALICTVSRAGTVFMASRLLFSLF